MSVRLYIGNLPQNVNVKELEALLSSIGDGIKFKAVFDRDTKACRGFGFANIKDENVANELIEKLIDLSKSLKVGPGYEEGSELTPVIFNGEAIELIKKCNSHC